MRWLKALFGIQPEPTVPTLIDPDFGKITYDGEETGIWQTDDDIKDADQQAEYGFSSIPGDIHGPFPRSRAFLLQKKNELGTLWHICSPTLREVAKQWRLQDGEKPQQAFILSSISIEKDFASSGIYRVGFKSTGDFWVYVTTTIRDGRVESYICDT